VTGYSRTTSSGDGATLAAADRDGAGLTAADDPPAALGDGEAGDLGADGVGAAGLQATALASRMASAVAGRGRTSTRTVCRTVHVGAPRATSSTRYSRSVEISS
jgi:hypothetical protein